ncbi:hypothetical protein H2P43_001641 [Campylobacter jejuni]|nr:hypothetical protein [Campylobacter jejuni]EFS0701701.1 hypothetical protein [Campylobacter jejuni]EHS1057433.1 hypothetical protein [Campylobacter jejuni]EHS1059183.1 hypothetical protein [Campylobacter jejuni]EHS1060955.1 hypothetical protein [Campylobacter jejuni]
MKKILTSVLALGAMVLIIGCGDGDLVELKNNGKDQTLFDLANKEIMKKYPNYKLYDYVSIRAISDIKNPEDKIKEMKRDLEMFGGGLYSNYVFILNPNNKKDYKVIHIRCDKDLKQRIYCIVNDIPRLY